MYFHFLYHSLIILTIFYSFFIYFFIYSLLLSFHSYFALFFHSFLTSYFTLFLHSFFPFLLLSINWHPLPLCHNSFNSSLSIKSISLLFYWIVVKTRSDNCISIVQHRMSEYENVYEVEQIIAIRTRHVSQLLSLYFFKSHFILPSSLLLTFLYLGPSWIFGQMERISLRTEHLGTWREHDQLRWYYGWFFN